MFLVPFWSLNVVGPLLSMEGQKALGFNKKYLYLCSENEQRSYGFGSTCAWVINDIIFIFGVNYHFKLTKSSIQWINPICARNRLKCELLFAESLSVCCFHILKLCVFHQVKTYMRINNVSLQRCQTCCDSLLMRSVWMFVNEIWELLSPSIWVLFRGAEEQLVLMYLWFCCYALEEGT